jgi:hypothetical protein
VHLDLLVVGVEVVELVLAEGLEALVTNAVREAEIRQVRALGQGQVPEILGVETVPDLRTGLVPEEGAARGDVLVGSEEGVELAGDG